MVPTARLLKLISALLVAGLALAGCSYQPGAAAVVDGRTITERQLAQASTELSEILGNPVSTPVVLQTLIVAPTAIQVASRNGLAVSAQQAQEMLEQESAQGEAGTVGEEEYSDPTLTVGRYLMLQNMITIDPEGAQIGAELSEAIDELDVELNPRYGEWDPMEGPTPVQPDWIVDPATDEA